MYVFIYCEYNQEEEKSSNGANTNNGSNALGANFLAKRKHIVVSLPS